MRAPLFALGLLTLLTASCAPKKHDPNEIWQLQRHEDEIVRRLNRMQLVETSMEAREYKDRFDKFSLGFNCYNRRFKTVDQARPFFVEAVLEILKVYNSTTKLQRFLTKDRVTVSDLWVKVNFYSSIFGLHLPAYNIFRIELKDSTITYYKWNTETKDLQAIHSESFEEACKKSPPEIIYN